ncbi:hypothetical protein Tco_1185930 [Tanacetum coccineum]
MVLVTMLELTLDRKYPTGGCQFLGNRLISWQCKKQTVVATSTCEAEYRGCAVAMDRTGKEVALFPSMILVSAPSTSPSRITSFTFSHSPEHSPSPTPSPSPEPTPDHTTAAATQPSPRTSHHLPTPHNSPLHAVHSYGSDEGSLKLNELTVLVTKLSDRIGVLEDDLRKTRKFNDEDIADDSSKQGRKLSDPEVQDKASNEIEPVIQDVTPIEVIQDQESSEKG